jgi:hypothetical protein
MCAKKKNSESDFAMAENQHVSGAGMLDSVMYRLG